MHSWEAPYKGGILENTEVTSVRLQQAFGAYHVQLISPSTPTATLSFSLKKNHNINLNNYFSNGFFFLTNIYKDLNLTHGI